MVSPVRPTFFLQEKHLLRLFKGDFPLSSGGVADSSEEGEPATSFDIDVGMGTSAGFSPESLLQLSLRLHIKESNYYANFSYDNIQ